MSLRQSAASHSARSDAIGQNVQCTCSCTGTTLCAPGSRTGCFISRMSTSRIFKGLLFLTACLLAGCNTVLLHPSGAVAAQQGHLIVQSTVLMLIIVIPVIVLTVVFAW